MSQHRRTPLDGGGPRFRPHRGLSSSPQTNQSTIIRFGSTASAGTCPQPKFSKNYSEALTFGTLRRTVEIGILPVSWTFEVLPMSRAFTRRSLLGGAGAAGMQLAAQPRAQSKPNLVVILFDDLGVADFGYLGASDLKTPHIDRLAAGGTVCTNWYSNAPVCAPARSALMTGRHPIRAGVANNGQPLRPTEKSIATLLKSGGYETALTGKWHLGQHAGDGTECPRLRLFLRLSGRVCRLLFPSLLLGRTAARQFSRPVAQPPGDFRGWALSHRTYR